MIFRMETLRISYLRISTFKIMLFRIIYFSVMLDIGFPIADLDTRVPIMPYDVFGFPLEVEGRSLLLKILHTYNTGLIFTPDPT